MTNHRALSFSHLTVTALTAGVLAAGVMLLSATAEAQSTECQPDDLLCAEVRIGPGTGRLRIGGGTQPAPPPPPPVVVQEPQPPVVIVQPQQPPPPPQVVQVQPPPPPQVVQVQPAPQPVYVQQPQPRVRPRTRYPYSQTGLHLHLGGLFGEELAMGGGGAAFRIRPNPHFALDIGSAIYGGNDYNGLDRVEVPLTVDAIFFFNPQHRFQFYALVGLGGSLGHAEGFNVNTDRLDDRDYAHLGGEAGFGVEWRLGRLFALNLDVRGFIRHRVDGNPEPEFREGGQSTDTSGGVIGQAGMTFYFGR